ncbi:MAG: glycosyltransferase family 2 protein [Alphaproteobacteria bacterium]
MNNGGGPSVAICTPTYRRRAQLLELCAAVNKLEFADRPPNIQVIIVDNSPGFEMADLRDKLPSLLRWPARLEHEPTPGLSAVRNKLLSLAEEAKVDFIAFVDDDERPRPDCLARLLARQRQSDADVVMGGVHGVLAPNAPRWLAAGGFFDSIPQPAFRGISGAHTANVLVRREVVARTAVSFESAFALTGGEDTMFFTRLERAGARTVQEPAAIVEEDVPPERARFAWLWRRWARTGSSEARLVVVLQPGLASRSYLLFGGLTRLAVGLAASVVFSPLALFGRAEAPMSKLKTAARGLGFVRGALGSDIVEYKRS